MLSLTNSFLVVNLFLVLSGRESLSLDFTQRKFGNEIETLFMVPWPFDRDAWRFENNSSTPNYSLDVPAMIKSYGYPVEVHEYTTVDGYVNILHRIPRRGGAQAVFMQHGLLGTSADFVMGSPQQSLGYMLFDMGFDVWLGNARGNVYSRSHIHWTTNDSAYWQFSFDEMGQFDVPAALEYVQQARSLDSESSRDASHPNKLVYIGHSMGTTMFWVAVDQHQIQMESLISEMIALAPVAQVQFVKSPLKYLAPMSREIETVFKLLGIDQFSPANWITKLFAEIVCDQTMRALKLCENILFLITGSDATNTNTTLIPYILGHEPGGTSTRTVVQFAQEIENKGRFQHFDYGGKDENLHHYGTATPPEYKLDKIRMPVHIFYGANDWLATPMDVLDNLYPRLTESVNKTKFSPHTKYNHVDFLWAKNMPTEVWPEIKKILDKYI